MKRKHKLTRARPISEINLTPLMDLTFILLITFIITFPLIEQGIPVNLPQGQAEELDPEKTRTITLDISGQVYLDDQPIGKEALTTEMNTLAQANPEMIILVRADETLKYGTVVDIMRILNQAGMSKVALVTRADNG
ncbi:MAG: biopolymer transporter ExbD [Spartobacteria bacterium]|nr:biopolymer transporter ExbD [Spartobacteria bacterium]